MTSIVGVLCTDGAVIGTDSSATFGKRPGQDTIEQPFDKLEVIDGQVIIAGTGQIGLGQRFSAIVHDAWKGKKYSKDHLEVARYLTKHTIDDFQQTYVRPDLFGALVAFPCAQRAMLCEFAEHDFQPEFKTDRLWYCSMGSAQFITDTFLALMRQVFWHDGPPTLQGGIFATTWTLQHAIDINPGGVSGPMKIAVLECGPKNVFQARLLDPSELEEHQQNVTEAKRWLGEFPNRQRSTATGVPEIPQP